MSIFYLLTGSVCSAYLALLLFYRRGWKQTPVPPAGALNSPGTHAPTGIRASVIIAARNEEDTLLRCLSALSRQDCFPEKFEIIVVDDHSTDRTAALVKKQGLPNLKLISLSENQRGKKQAIAEGIKHSDGRLILTTDADCEMGAQWVSSVLSFHDRCRPKMIVGPVLLKGDKGFLGAIQAQEMLALSAAACGSLHYHLPLLCSGANLVYEKEAFLAVNGFDGVETTATGDDTFLLLKFHRKFRGDIKFLKSGEALVSTFPEKTLAGAFRQRKRWASKIALYRSAAVLLVAGIVFSANFFVFLAVILSVINVKFAYALILALPIKCAADYMLIGTVSAFFEKKLNFFRFMFASFLYPPFVVCTGIVAPFARYSWKGRKS